MFNYKFKHRDKHRKIAQMILNKRLIIMLKSRATAENFPGGDGQQKKDRKIAKKTENSTIKPLPGGSNRKNDQKIALFSLYLLYLYHLWKSRRHGPPASRCRRP